MENYTYATPMTSATINIVTDSDSTTSKTVAVGDTITNLVIAANDTLKEGKTINSCTVIGFNIVRVRTPYPNTTIIDGTPVYGGKFGEPQYMYDTMTIEIPDEDSKMIVKIADIKSIGEVTPAAEKA